MFCLCMVIVCFLWSVFVVLLCFLVSCGWFYGYFSSFIIVYALFVAHPCKCIHCCETTRVNGPSLKLMHVQKSISKDSTTECLHALN